LDPLFLEIDEVLDIHRDQIAKYGGSSGVRDMALLQSALIAAGCLHHHSPGCNILFGAGGAQTCDNM